MTYFIKTNNVNKLGYILASQPTFFERFPWDY